MIAGCPATVIDAFERLFIRIDSDTFQPFAQINNSTFIGVWRGMWAMKMRYFSSEEKRTREPLPSLMSPSNALINDSTACHFKPDGGGV